MRVLLSIKPEYALKIFEGTKRFEYRRSIFKNKNIKTILVYASSPLQQVIGEFEIETILNEKLNDLWKNTKEYSGISEEYFFKYFSQKEKGFAIKIKNVKMYKHPLCITKDFKVKPPQSFLYIEKDDQLESL